MKKILFALIFFWALVAITVLAQEQKGMPMGGGGMMEMKSHMGEMQKSMGGMMKGEESGKGGMEGMGDMDGMMRMMKMMGQCAAMMEKCCPASDSDMAKEGPKQ